LVVDLENSSPKPALRRYNSFVERTTLMRAIKDCFEALRIHHGWGIAEVAQQLGVHYETARRLRAGEIKEPSFTLVSGLHSLAQRSIDNWVGISPTATAAGASLMEDRVRELVADQLGQMLTRGLTLQLPLGANGEVIEDGMATRFKSTPWVLNTETRHTEDALLKAGQTLVEELPPLEGEQPVLERIKRRPRTGQQAKKGIAAVRR
jgi:hypothetical protein